MKHVSIAIPVACCLGMAAFAVSVLSGVGTQNDFSLTLGRALLSLLIAWPIGYLIGRVLEHLFHQNSTWGLRAGMTEVAVNNGDVAPKANAVPLDSTGLESDGEEALGGSAEAVPEEAVKPL